MSDSLRTQIEELHRSIEGLEAQREALGEAVVGPALAALRKQLSALEAQAAAQAAPAEERRLVTILFVDVVGSTSMAEKVDPEEWHGVLKRLHGTLGELVTSHHGEVGKFLGDGMLAYFGLREASEEDPENAIRAALEAQAAVTELLSVEQVQIRAGVHTGLVVMGELGEATHMEFTATGDAMNLAARLQSAAPAGGVLISHDTYRYVRGVFDLTPQPPLTVKGKSQPVQTYLVRRAKPRPFRRATRGVAGVETRTVGREAEIEALQAAYLKAYEGHGVVWAQMISEPGVGKSRLLADVSDWMDLRPETYRLLRARAFPDDANQPYTLVRRMWFDRFQIADDLALAQAEAKWVERFKELSGDSDCEEAAHALGLLVGLPFADSPYIGAMRDDPAQVKGRAFVVSRELVVSVRQQLPVVVLLEDLQWCDAASWEYLMEVFLVDAEQEQPNGMFIVGAARPEWCPPPELAQLLRSGLSGEARCGSLISLPPLSQEASHELARELLQRATGVPEDVIDLLVERAEGVPYFAEEMVNWFIDHGILDTTSEPWRFVPEKLKEQPLPATLQHLLLTRLSSLSQPERVALQRGAIFGRHFWTGGVEALGAPADTLGKLAPRGFVEAQPESAFEGDTEWSFRHSLLREVTYESVLKRERAALHKVAADWLELQARRAGRLDEFAGLLAEHCERAGELSAAADWYLKAGRRAMMQGAPREAKGFYTRALDLLPPVDSERRWQALCGRQESLETLGEGEAWKADVTALVEMARSLGDDNKLAEACVRQAICGIRAGDNPIVPAAVQEALAAAQRCGNETVEAKALALLEAKDLEQNDKVAARQHLEQALTLARRVGDDSVLSFVLFRAGLGYGEMGEFALCDRLYNEQVALDHRRGDRAQEALGLGNLGAQYVGIGLWKQARAILERSRALKEALGARRMLAYDLSNLAEIHRSTGDLRKARELVEQALKAIEPTHDARGQAMLLGGFGLVLLDMGDVAGARRRFEEGRELAAVQGLAGDEVEYTCYLAKCAALEGQMEHARTLVHQVWKHLKAQGWTGMASPQVVYLYCAEVFDALGETENLREELELGHQAFMDVANSIDIPEWRQSFLENMPETRAFLEMWQRNRR